MHAAQGMTREAAIGVLDSGHGRLTGQAGLYVEASRARDRFVLVTDNRELLEEALEENEGARLTAREAVGEDNDPPPASPGHRSGGAPAAVLGMLRELREDWGAMRARVEVEAVELDRMEDYARIVTGVAALADGMDLPPDLGRFAAEVRRTDQEIVERRGRELAFVQKAEMHGRRRPLLTWAANERRVPVSELPEHAAWRAEGEALAETGRGMRERVGEGLAGRIAAALRRVTRSLGLDDAERFRDAALRHEAQAREAGIDPRAMPGADELAERARALEQQEMSERVRETVAAWCAEDVAPHLETAPRCPRHPEDEEAARRIEAFLRNCHRHLDASPSGAPEPEARIDRTEELRREGLRMLGEGEGAKLDDPARIRLARGADERERVRAMVDALADEAQRLRGARFMDLRRRVDRLAREAGSDPADVPEWQTLRARAEDLRGAPGLAPEVGEAVDAVLAHAARVEAETAPVEALLAAGARHLEQRATLEETSPSRAVSAWRDRSGELRETARRLLGDVRGDAAETQAAARIADMPHLRGRVREVLDRLETVELEDRAAEFRTLARAVGARARRERTLPLNAEGYDRATAMAESLADHEALPDGVRQEANDWIERDRGWRAELASIRELSALHGGKADPALLREAADLPAVADAILRETARLVRLPALEHGTPWTGEAPLIEGDRIEWRSGADVLQGVVEFPGEAGGMRESDVLQVRLMRRGGRAMSATAPLVDISARSLADGGCARAVWSDEGLRELALARQRSVPSQSCRLPCPEPVESDRIAWTEAAGPRGEVRTIEAVVAVRTGYSDGHSLDLRVIHASGPAAPEPGSRIGRTAEAVTARGCYRAEWKDEARRARILDPPKQAEERTPAEKQEREQEREQRQEISRRHGFRM